MIDAASTGPDAEGGALGGPGLTTAQLTGAWHLGPAPVVLAHFLGRPAGVITALASAAPG